MSAILYHVPLTRIRTQRKLLMPNSVLTSSCVLTFIEQAQYSVLVPSFLQAYTTFTLLYAVCLGKEQGLRILQRKAFSSAWVYSFTSPSYLLHFLHQVQRGWSFVGHLPFGSNNTGSSNKTTSSKLGPKYLPMGTYHIGMLPLRTEGCACRALEHGSPLTPRHAGNAPATILLLPQQCPRLAFFPMLKNSCRIQDVNPNPPVESGRESIPLGETPGGQSHAANATKKSFHWWVKGTLVRNGQVSQTREGECRGPAEE